MASIKDSIARNKARIAAGGQTGTGIGPQSSLVAAPTPPQDLPIGNGIPQRGMFSADLVLASDRSDSSRAFRGQGTRSAAFPYQVQGIKKAPTIVIPATSAAAAAVELSLQTNGLPNPNQNLLNLVQGANVSITASPDGSVVIAGGGGDGLIHGASIWEADPAYVILRDDFLTFTATTPSSNSNEQLGELGWAGYGTGTNRGSIGGGESGHLGQYAWSNSATSSQAMAIALNGNTSNASYFQGGLSLLDNPSWQMTWVWKWDGLLSGSGNFNITKKSFYIGLAGTTFPSTINGSGAGARPDVFVGLRYDTSATPGTLTLSSVANASAGTSVYTGTITGGGNGAYIGLTFTVAGFTNAANNGIFICTQSSVTTLTLANASGIAESHAATATAPGLNDSFFTFEAVVNPSFGTAARHNAQGSTQVTTIAPASGVWHRLDMICTAPGVVTMTLDGAATFTTTVPAFTALSPSSSGAVAVNNGIAAVSPSTSTSGTGVWSAGSEITLSGLTGGDTGLNGVHTVIYSTGTTLFFDTKVGNIGNHGASFTTVGLPALIPYCCFGNDDSVSVVSDTTAFVDFFSFVWNPGVGGGTGTPNPALSRYW